jgi:uncharacterized protein YcfJ
MNHIKFTGALLAGISLLALAACNEDAKLSSQAASAQTVVAAKAPREVCEDKLVTTQKKVKDKDRVLGTIAGAVVGGVVGHEVGGKGTSQDIATVGGAAAGGYAGNRVQKSVQDNATETHTERVCHTVYD